MFSDKKWLISKIDNKMTFYQKIDAVKKKMIYVETSIVKL